MGNKVIELPQSNQDIFSQRIPLQVLKEIWNSNCDEYTDSELIKIREWLYALAELAIEMYSNPKYENLIYDFKQWQNERKESDIICASEYRRAS